ncbi:MAG TPA: hypothetical protein VGI19_10810 [Candidatus Cybelea sp.]
MPQLPSQALPPSATPAHSWMLPEAAREPLLYVTGQNEVVYVLSYPQGKLVGMLSGVNGAQTLCTDRHHHIFVTAFNTESIDEYAHGGTTPIAKLEDYGYYPVGCAVDPASGNLAVANFGNMSGAGASVAIYTNAKGQPNYYKASNFLGFDWCSYDDHGNLFINGVDQGFEELRAGSPAFFPISVPVSGEAIHWDGKYFAIVNPLARQLYRVAVFNLNGVVVSKINFSGPLNQVGDDFAVVDGRLVMPFAKRAVDSRIGFWPYLQGGAPHKTIRFPGYAFVSIAFSR